MLYFDFLHRLKNKDLIIINGWVIRESDLK